MSLVNGKRIKRQTSKIIWCYVNLKGRRYSRGAGKANYGEGKEKLVSQRIRSNEGCAFVVGRRLCSLGENVVIL